VFEENVNYGFRRNMLGLRPWGIAIAAVVIIVSTAAFLLTDGTSSELLRAWAWPATLAALAALVWWKVVTPDWVRLPGEAYADRLMEALESLSPQQSQPQPASNDPVD